MNYIAELNAFDDYLDRNPDLSANARLLWTRLIQAANRAMWKQPFTIALSYLSHKTGLSVKAIQRARDELRQGGLINWESRGGNLSAQYTVLSLVSLTDQQSVQQSVQQLSNKVSTYININKNINTDSNSLSRNTNTSIVEHIDNMERAKKECFRLYQELIEPTPSPKTIDRLSALYEDYGENSLKKAIQESHDDKAYSVTWLERKLDNPSPKRSRYRKDEEVDWKNQPNGIRKR